MRTNQGKWLELKAGLKTLLSRNAIITILFNIAYAYSTYMKNAYRPLVVKVACGLPVSYVTTLASLFSFVALLCNVPIGSIIDQKRESMKWVLIIVNLLRGLMYIFGFGMVQSEVGVILLYIVDGVIFAVCNIMGPALMAISVDKKAMGSAFALYSGVTQICISSSRSLGVSLFNETSQLSAGLVSGIIAIVSGLILLLLDKKQLTATLRKELENQQTKPASPLAAPKTQKKHTLKQIFSGLCVTAIPLALCIGLAQIEDSVNNSYLAILAMDSGFDYYTAQTMLAALSGVITIFIGAICDLVSPVFMVYLGLAGKIVGNFLISGATSQSVFLTGFVFITATDFFITVVRVSAIKLFSYREQGGLAATISFMMSICMMFGTLPAGFIAQATHVGNAYLYSAATSLLGMFMYTYAIIYLKRRKKREEFIQQATE